MAKPLLPDELWERIEPLLPPPKPRRFRFPGRKPLDNRKALTGILFVLKTGIPWECLPLEMGGGGMTRWRRLRDRQAAGVWRQLHEIRRRSPVGAQDGGRMAHITEPTRCKLPRCAPTRERLRFFSLKTENQGHGKTVGWPVETQDADRRPI